MLCKIIKESDDMNLLMAPPDSPKYGRDLNTCFHPLSLTISNPVGVHPHSR